MPIARARSTLAFVTLSCAAVVTCNVFEPPELESDGGAATGGVGANGGTGGVDASAGTAGGGTGGGGQSGAGGGTPGAEWWTRTSPQGCESAGVPTAADRPQGAENGPDLDPIYLATSRMRFGSANDDEALTGNKDAWKEIGFDLDETCTASETCTVEGGTSYACKNDLLIPVDGKACRDNQIGNLFPVAALSPIVGPLFGITEPNWNCALHRGEFTIFFKISHYDGTPDDPSVRVDMYTSIGLQSLPNWTCTSGPQGSVPPDWYNQAPWLHVEHWKIAARSIALNAQNPPPEVPDSKYADVAGFVRDGWLFAQLPAATELWLDGQRSHVPGFRLQLHRSVLVGKLAKAPNGTWTLDQGTFGGVVLPTEILSAFREIAFCENMCDAYQSVVLYLNTNQDTLSGTSEKLPDTPCNALSIGIAFEARQAMATAADVENVDPPVDCPPPKHPLVPKHGCVCPDPDAGGGPCVLPDAGVDGGN